MPTRQRRPGWVALAVALIVGFAATGAWLYLQAGSKTPVVVVVADVPAGHTIDRSDLSTVAVAGEVTAIAGENLDSVVGQIAAVHLMPNMLLQRSMVTENSGLLASMAEVGVAVKSGQVPADGLKPGDQVQIVGLPDAAAAEEQSVRVLVEKAQVYAVREDPAQAGGTLLTLVVPKANAAEVAAASGSGQIAVIRVGA